MIHSLDSLSLLAHTKMLIEIPVPIRIISFGVLAFTYRVSHTVERERSLLVLRGTSTAYLAFEV